MGIAVQMTMIRAANTVYSVLSVSGKVDGPELQEASFKIDHPWRCGGLDLRFAQMTAGNIPKASIRPSNVAPGAMDLCDHAGPPADDDGDSIVLCAATEAVEENGSLVMVGGEYILAVSTEAEGVAEVTGSIVFAP